MFTEAILGIMLANILIVATTAVHCCAALIG